MTGESLVSNLYHAALPALRDEPLPRMPKSLYRYVLKVSGRQQVRLCLLTVLVFPLTLAPLELQRRIIDTAIGGGDFGMLVLLSGLYLAALVTQGGLKYLSNVYLNRVAEGVTRILRLRVTHSETFGTDPDEGTKQSILSSEAEKVGGFVAESMAFPLLQTGIVASVAVYMLVVNPLIAGVAIGFLLPSSIVVAVSQPFLNRLSETKVTTVRELGQIVLSDDRHEVLKGKDRDPDSVIERIYALRVRFAIVKNAAKGLNNLINNLGPLSVLMMGGWLVIHGQAQLGTIVAFMSGYGRMTDPARELLNFYRRFAVMRVQYGLVYQAGQGSAKT